MNSDELSRGMSNNHYTRKPMPTKYSEKNYSYGSGQNYGYGNQPYNGNSHYNNSYNNNGHNGPQNQRRRPDRFKRDNYNYNERLVKQNDIIIRLLKEIRDRLPAPPQTDENQYYEEDQDQRMEQNENVQEDDHDAEEEVLMEPANGEFVSEQDQFNEEENN